MGFGETNVRTRRGVALSPAGEFDPAEAARPDSAPALVPSPDEVVLIEALRRGDENAFVELVRRHQSMLKRVARLYVSSEAVAEEVLQETWLGVFQGIQRFEGRASLKTWIFRILTNRARSRGEREARTVPFSALVAKEVGVGDPAVEPERFLDSTDPLPGHWGVPPKRWGDDPEQWVTSKETLDFLSGALDLLPPIQRQVVELRDIQEWTADEVCAALDITEANQRVLLHRGRSKLRGALEKHFERRVADA